MRPTQQDLAQAQSSARAAWNESFVPILEELRVELQARGPEEVAALSGAEWRADVAEFHLHRLDVPYRITWPELVAYTLGSAEPCPANLQGLFLYYLSIADGAPAAGQWLSFRELPDGWLYQQAFQGYTGHVLVQALGNDVDAFAAGARAAGGEAIDAGDSGFAFQAMPGIRLAVVYWQGDDEFPPEAQVLFDAAASHYMTTDGLAGLGAHLIGRILKAAR